MIRLLTVIGARPQIIKAAAVSRAIREHFGDSVTDCILHTGQHYDENMSAQLFTELNIPQPTYNLGVGSGSHSGQTARMLTGIEEVMTHESYDGVLVYGDTNSTLAGALAASKLQVPVFHVEAGLRSFNMAMPEEQNRIVADHLSNICFAPTQTAVDNLQREGLIDSPTLFNNNRRRKVVLSGDIMYDNSLYFAQIATLRCNILEQHHLQQGSYILATVHRNYNTDDPTRLYQIFNALATIAATRGCHKRN